jgi:hypothetical protein
VSRHSCGPDSARACLTASRAMRQVHRPSARRGLPLDLCRGLGSRAHGLPPADPAVAPRELGTPTALRCGANVSSPRTAACVHPDHPRPRRADGAERAARCPRRGESRVLQVCSGDGRAPWRRRGGSKLHRPAYARLDVRPAPSGTRSRAWRVAPAAGVAVSRPRPTCSPPLPSRPRRAHAGALGTAYPEPQPHPPVRSE